MDQEIDLPAITTLTHGKMQCCVYIFMLCAPELRLLNVKLCGEERGKAGIAAKLSDYL